jgi:hypothetical protein
MGGVDSFEVGLSPSSETLGRTFNRKLCAVLLAAGIELGECENEIVESASQIVTSLPNQNSDAHCYESLAWQERSWTSLRELRIELQSDRILLQTQSLGDFPFQINKVFICPPYSFESAIESVGCHDIIP